ncbi:hypothetical protein ACLB1R_34675 [Escherichia coli]
MIKVITLLLFALLTGCQSVESKIEELPTVGFDPILYNKSEAFTDGKVTLRVESSSTFGLSPRMEPEVLLSFQA